MTDSQDQVNETTPATSADASEDLEKNKPDILVIDKIGLYISVLNWVIGSTEASDNILMKYFMHKFHPEALVMSRLSIREYNPTWQ